MRREQGSNNEQKAREREARELRGRVLLVCPDNDAESHTIIELAKKAGIAVMVSDQPHGAKLDQEGDLAERVLSFGKQEVWIVEIPGIEEEEALRRQGLAVKVIDHHTYEDLDRLADEETGEPKPSSLEQFLEKARISDDEMVSWGLKPKIVRGVGIMDAQYARGLREAGYTQEEINEVLEIKQAYHREANPEYEAIQHAAEEAWENSTQRGDYIVLVSDAGTRVRGAIAEMSIRKSLDTQPLVISVKNGERISVQNVDAEVIEKLNESFRDGTYTFGSGRCWGVNNAKRETAVVLEEIMQVLEEAP